MERSIFYCWGGLTLTLVYIKIAPNSQVRKRGKKWGEVKGSMEEFEGSKRELLTSG